MERLRHMVVIGRMPCSRMLEYLETVEVGSGLMWQHLALRVALEVGRLPEALHNRMLMEPGGGRLAREYLERIGDVRVECQG